MLYCNQVHFAAMASSQPSSSRQEYEQLLSCWQSDDFTKNSPVGKDVDPWLIMPYMMHALEKALMEEFPTVVDFDHCPAACYELARVLQGCKKHGHIYEILSFYTRFLRESKREAVSDEDEASS